MSKMSKCYQCGFCCTVSACGYGKWDAKNHKCQFLNTDSTCSRYAFIVETEKNSILAMMGSGCSSPLCNERRNAKMTALGISPEEALEEMNFPPDIKQVFNTINNP
jgi:hypothetical protein